jgi:uncharacterized protein
VEDMFRKVTVMLTTLLLSLFLLLPVYAQTTDFVIDEAGLLRSEQIDTLQEMAAELKEHYEIDAVILTVDSLGGTYAQDYADDYYDNAGYGDDGVLFLLAMEEREWYISTSGSVIYTLTDYGIQKIGEGAVSYFADGLWFEGFAYFLNNLSYYLDALENGAPVDGFADFSGDYYHGDQEEVVYYQEETSPNFVLSLLCGLGAAGISIFVMRSAMNTKRSQRGAGDYLKKDSWNLYQHRDLFLYSNITKSRRQEESKSSSGGGSSVHRSSGGRSHGGGGGKF